jgi:hypothetical protein
MPSIGVAVQSMLLTLLGPQCDCQTNGKYGSKGMHIPYHGIIISSSLPSSLSSSPALRGSAAYGAAMVQETVRAFLFTDVRCHRLPVATLYTPPTGIGPKYKNASHATRLSSTGVDVLRLHELQRQSDPPQAADVGATPNVRTATTKNAWCSFAALNNEGTSGGMANPAAVPMPCATFWTSVKVRSSCSKSCAICSLLDAGTRADPGMRIVFCMLTIVDSSCLHTEAATPFLCPRPFSRLAEPAASHAPPPSQCLELPFLHPSCPAALSARLPAAYFSLYELFSSPSSSSSYSF